MPVATFNCALRVPAASDGGGAAATGFPSFLPKEVEKVRDPVAREMARRMQRVPVKINSISNTIMSSCVKPLHQKDANPVVLLHGFDSSCLEWAYSYPLLEDAGLETWAIDILGWGFSDLQELPSTSAASKREHLYQLWRSHIRRPMILVGPSLGAAVSIDFAASHPEAVSKLVLIGPNVYAKGVGKMSKLPRPVAYAGVSLLKSTPLRLLASSLAFKNHSLVTNIDWTKVSRLHCLQPWWEHATIDFMLSGGYDVVSKIKKIKHKTTVICGVEDRLANSDLALKLHAELQDSELHLIPNCGHLPHVEKPITLTNAIVKFLSQDQDAARKVLAVIGYSART